MLNDTDLERIASALSGDYGAFSISNLVNYGSTIVVRPGARTSPGVVLSGPEINAMLPPDYVAVPFVVEYGAEPGGDLGEDIESLHAEVSAIGAAPLGGKVAAIRARYARVTERFRQRVARVVAAQSAGRAGAIAATTARAKASLRRLSATWKRMGQRGIDRSGLVSPTRLSAEMSGLKTIPSARVRPSSSIPSIPTRHVSTRPTAVRPAMSIFPSRVAPTTSATAPAAPVQSAPAKRVYTPVSKAYLADQAALEREIKAGTPSYFGASDYAMGQESLAADLRAETVGYLFGPVEHDYFGVSFEDVEVEFTSDDFRDLLGRDVGAALSSVFSDNDLSSLDAASMIDVLDGIVASETLEGRADRLGRLAPRAADRVRAEARRRFNTAHLAKVRLESLYPSRRVRRADDDLDELDLDDLDDMLGGGDVVDEADEAGEAGEAGEADEDGGGDGGDEDDESKDDKPSRSIDSKQAKAANLQRRALLPSVAEIRSVGERGEGGVLDRADRAARLVTQITDVLRSVSPSGSVNYARLRPSLGGAVKDPVIVIGIQKRTGSTTDILDQLFQEEVTQVSNGYDVPDAVAMVTQVTTVSDYLGGSQNRGSTNFLALLVRPCTNAEGMSDVEQVLYGPVLYGAGNKYAVIGVAADAWPNGNAAPLPPPRRTGVEVYGG